MNRKSLVLPLLLSVAVVACKREAPAAPETVAPAAVAKDIAPVSIDRPSFVGTFKGTLPCADCPGIDETVTLNPDGSFTLTDAYRDRPQGPQDLAGRWTTEENDSRLRLTPDAGQDRVFAINSNDQITPLDAGGKPSGRSQRYSLKRSQ